ncbi:MAG TPA: FAD-binding oxidoreductase [Acidimicrobiales bacterium]|nr:FAD-binding oxidoreductase [Acidimicrobiales bacterium]
MSALRDDLASVVGQGNVVDDPDVVASYTVDWTRRWHGPAALVVRPGSTHEVVGVVAACRSAGVSLIPQGGNTGLVGGGVPGRPIAGMGERLPVVVSLTRLTQLDAVDEEAAQVTAGAGVTLARLQSSAASCGLAFAVDLAARDSASVGGMVATNAGGVHLLRYGGMRQQVVGIEAVLADGRVVSRLDGLVKDNTGYDLSSLLVGSEGTLGVVTKARLRLVAALPERVTALVGVAGTREALAALVALRRSVGSLDAVEIFYPEGLEVVRAHSGLPAPLPRAWGAYLLVECADRTDPTDSLAEALGLAGVADDASAVAADPAGRAALWAYRERHTEAVAALGVAHKLDVSLPLGRLAEFEASVRSVVESAAPSAVVVLWGHVGDGNLHVNVVGPPADDDTVDDAVLRLAAGMGGSISAEHGIGRAKLRWLGLTRSVAEITTMMDIKRALDPDGLLNPGVLLPPS